MIHVERTRCVCDQCHELTQGFIISSLFNNDVTDTIQLCEEHAKWLATELGEVRSNG